MPAQPFEHGPADGPTPCLAVSTNDHRDQTPKLALDITSSCARSRKASVSAFHFPSSLPSRWFHGPGSHPSSCPGHKPPSLRAQIDVSRLLSQRVLMS
jgi:hypothetical protein